MTARVEVLGDDGKWREVEGVASVEVHAEAPDVTPAERAGQVMQLFGAYAREAVAEYERACAQVVQQLKGAAAAAQAYEAAIRPPRDRPAWQSTYGPARRRR